MSTYTNIRIESSYDGFTKGGGEILYYLNLSNNTTDSIDWNLVVQFSLIPYMKGVLTLLLLVLGIMYYFDVYNIRLINYGGVAKQISNLKSRRSKDRRIIGLNKSLSRLTNFVESTLFRSSKYNDRLEYALKRAKWCVPGGYRTLEVKEFNALTKLGIFITVIVGLIVTVLINNIAGLIILIVGVTTFTVLIKQVLFSIVKEKDDIIKDNFSNLYFMLHYTLLSGGKTPLVKIFSAYRRSLDDDGAMSDFVRDCINNFDLYGEYSGALVISEQYREIYEVQKLMKLIRQFNSGGEIYQDLIGFREEIIDSKKYRLGLITEKLCAKAETSINLVFILLFQTVVSVASIYLEDIFRGFY